MVYHLTCFALYCCFLLVIAKFAQKKTKGASDFYLGGRSLNAPLTALGAGASDMSSWLLMVLPGIIYTKGLSQIWMPFAILVGAYANWRFVSAPLRIYTEKANNSLTITSFFRNRFSSDARQGKQLNAIAGGAILLFFTLYCASGLIAGAALLQLLFDLSRPSSLLLFTVTILTYTAIGGFLAVSWVDLFQGILMFLSLLIVPAITLMTLSSEQTLHLSPDSLNIFSTIHPLGIVSLLAWGLGYFGQPHIQTRFMAVQSIEQLPLATRLCLTWMFASLLGAVLTGLLGSVYFSTEPLAQPNTVFIVLSQILFHPLVASILISAILSAIMSTVSAQLLMCASIITEDFYLAFKKNKHQETSLLIESRIALLLIALVALGVAMVPNQTLFSVVGIAWSGLGAALGPTLLMCLYNRKMTAGAALTGIITGSAVVLAWKLLAALQISEIFSHSGYLPGIELLPGFVCSMLAITIYCRYYPQTDPHILATFSNVHRLLKKPGKSRGKK